MNNMAVLVAQSAAAEEIYPFKVGKWGYVSEHGKVVIKPQLDEAYFFISGVAVAKKDEKRAINSSIGMTQTARFAFIRTKLETNISSKTSKERFYGAHNKSLGTDGRAFFYFGLNALLLKIKVKK
jgi:hypothetical protein